MSIRISLSQRKNPAKPDEPMKVYATAQVTKSYSLDEFCDHIAKHGSIWTPDIVSGVVRKTVECLEELILDGAQVNLGALGTFKPTVTSRGASEFDSFDTLTNIKKVSVCWKKGYYFRNMKGQAKFERVLTRKDEAEAKVKAYGV